MNRVVKKIIVVIVLLVLGYLAARYYVYHAGKRDVQSEKTAFITTSKSIVAEFTANEATANKKYLEKPVTVSGVVTSVKGKEIILDQVVVCNFLNQDVALKVGQTYAVKGRVVGYDDLLGAVNLDQCSINK